MNGQPAWDFIGDDLKSLSGRCSHCQRSVDNHDELHRVTSIVRGGRGVECVLRGDIDPHEARPLGFRPEPCTHESLSGVDQTPLDNAAKVWKCDECDAVMAGRSTDGWIAERIDRIPGHISPPADGIVYLEIDRIPYRLNAGDYTGRQIRHFAHPPIGEDRDLWLFQPGANDLLISYDDLAVIRHSGHRFFTMPRHINGGC